MKLTQITPSLNDYPKELQPFLSNARLFDSSSSPAAKVIYIDKDSGYFLKSAPKGSLEREAKMTQYFNTKGLSAKVLEYISGEIDYLLTERVQGGDCTAEMYLQHPKRLCDTLAERLFLLHNTDFSDCPMPNHTKQYIKRAADNYHSGIYDNSLFPDNWGYETADQAYRVVIEQGGLLQADTVLHGDYCLPNVILNDWAFSGFIDLDCSGVGDRHVDLFWGAWSLSYNLKTDRYRERFFDAYGRSFIDEERFKIIAAIEVFG